MERRTPSCACPEAIAEESHQAKRDGTPSTRLPNPNPKLYNANSRQGPMKTTTSILFLLAVTLPTFADSKPKLTLDDFFNAVGYTSVELSPDGNNVVIGTERADWDQQIFRKDLWLYRTKDEGGSLIQFTQSGHDTEPKWSPDGRWVAFLSERKVSSEKDADDDNDEKGEISQIYVISPSGGEAVQLTQGQGDVHSFAWSADSHTLYYSTRHPWTKEQKDDYREQWKDVVQYRTAERGDTVFALDLSAALQRNFASAKKESTKEQSEAEKESDLTPGARELASLPLRVDEIATSPDGTKLALLTNAINQRQEKYEDVEIYELNVARPPSAANAASTDKPAEPRRLTHNQAIEVRPRWANDSRHIFFEVEVGDVTGPYRDLQPHLYWVDTETRDSETGTVEQWSKDFTGEITHYAVASNTILTAARLGTEVPMYSITKPNQQLQKLNSWSGTYENISAAQHSPRVAFLYSSLQKPTEVYLAESPDKLSEAKPITNLNATLADKDLPQGKPYRWKADDGTTVEGMLIYPPGKFEAEKSAHVHLHPRWPRRRRRQPLRSRLVSMVRASRHQRMAGLRAQLPRLNRIRRQVPNPNRSRKSSRVPAKTSSKA